MTLGGTIDVTEPVRNQPTPDLLWVEVRNIGEAETAGPVWVDLYNDMTWINRQQTQNSIAPGNSEFLAFDWIPISGTSEARFEVDPQFFACPNPQGCETEYNDQTLGVNDNETNRHLPELETINVNAE